MHLSVHAGILKHVSHQLRTLQDDTTTDAFTGSNPLEAFQIPLDINVVPSFHSRTYMRKRARKVWGDVRNSFGGMCRESGRRRMTRIAGPLLDARCFSR